LVGQNPLKKKLLFCTFQTLDKKAVSGNHLDPLNIVFLLHGVLRKRSDLTKYRAIADIPATKNVAALISIDTRKGGKQLLTLKSARIAIAWGTGYTTCTVNTCQYDQRS
jgi:hypothetical protein